MTRKKQLSPQAEKSLGMQAKDFFSLEQLRKYARSTGCATCAHTRLSKELPSDREYTVQEFLNEYTSERLGKIPGFGRKSIEAITETLRWSDLSFKK